MHIDGRSALVTGAASGLGLATVTRLAAAGAAVTAVDLPTADTKALREVSGTVTFAGGDVTDEAAIAGAMAQANADHSLSVVVNCAGINLPHKTLSKQGPFPLGVFDRVVQVNLIGTFNVLRLAADAMTANEPVGGERGVIINTASIAAFDGQIGQAAYAASKGGVAALTLPAARDLAPHLIRVVTIAPGLFETPMLGALPDEIRASLGAQVPHPSRLGRPAEYADLVAAIVHNQMLNGEVIRLDGAIRLAPR
ncbi:SDR family NAD(P)-dependent oxidoreductase [Streptomyces sp. NPDC048002]|uniref:SDR family NAD(P)-dependent oxidoreductase n=1 Tax=Streptomyces sp. NPDC048002 TaxID=3154344 RepID=UPI0033F5434F